MTVNPAAGPCQRWTDQRATYRDPAERIQSGRYEVTRVVEATARPFVERHHYSGTWPSTRFPFGLTDRQTGDLVGVAALSVPVQVKLLTGALPELDPFRQSLELGRFVLLDEVPGNAESFFLGHVLRQSADEGIRGVVSLSDPYFGHVGTIYQATNARYTGQTGRRTNWVLPDGTVFPGRAMQKIRAQEQGHAYAEARLVEAGARPLAAGESPAVWLGEALRAIGASSVRHPGQHRYVFRVGNRAERRRTIIGLPALAYPKANRSQLAKAA